MPFPTTKPARQSTRCRGHRVACRWGCRFRFLVFCLGLLTSIARGQEDVAPVTRSEAGADDTRALVETPLAESDRDHWAFRPVGRFIPPSTVNSRWSRGGIDSFLLSRLEQAVLKPAVEADRATLLRRLTFDLTGLPPTLNELQDFEASSAPDAYEQQVERLLASPAYGQRWGQHWLDLARFAETDGFEHDLVRADAWKYRDWVIAALNENIPYDRFITLQLAGDLQGDLSLSVATMFCLSGPDMPDVNDQFERRHLMLNEITATVGSVFLGLQFGCAECHDHKYDPVSQGDFYRLRAVFESAVPQLKRDVANPRLVQVESTAPARLWIRGDHRRPGPRVEPGFPRIASQSNLGDSPDMKRSPRTELATWMTRPDNPLTARVIVNRVWKHHFGRGLFDTPSDVGLLNAEPTHPELLDWLATQLPQHDWDLKWLHRQMVESAAYRQTSRGDRTDPEWIRRLERDPGNVLYSRGHRRRLDGESLRDALLAISGQLSDERGGPGVMPPLPDELVGTLLKGQWTTSPRAADHSRRSIYLFARRNLRYPLFEVFDRPDANASCAVRGRSTTPIQSLLMLNSAEVLRASQHLAGRILAETRDPAKQIDLVMQKTCARHPTEEESKLLLAFLNTERNQLQREQRAARDLALPIGCESFEDLEAAAALVEACLAAFNSSEMVYVD